jgi:small subunit ribosomal protein S2
MFVIDSSRETIALLEARKMGVPIVAIVDTNGDPDNLTYPIPGNDDAVRAIELFAGKMAEAILDGKKARIEKSMLQDKAQESPADEAELDLA